MYLANRVIKNFRGGPDQYVLAGKPVGDGRKTIYLLNSTGRDPNFTLWEAEDIDNENTQFSPYNGEDSEDLIEELKEKFIENAHEVL